MKKVSKAVRGPGEKILVVEVVPEITQPVALQDDGLSVGKLTELEFMQLQLLQARMEVQRAVKDKLKFQEVELGRSYQEQRDVVRGQQLDATRAVDALRKDYDRALDAIHARLGFSIKSYNIREDGSLIPGDAVETE